MNESSSQSLHPEQTPEQVTESKPPNSINEDLRSSLATKDSLGAVLTKQGRYDEAATLLQEVLDTRERLGQSKADLEMLCTMNNLGAALNHQGRLAEAEMLHRQVLESDEQILGSEHPTTITSMHNLAGVLRGQGKLDEAEGLQRRALELSQKVRGPEMPETLGIMGNLGDILLRQQKYEQAETVSREVLHLRRKVLRENHPDIATSMHNLAAVLRKRGKLDEAEELQRQEAVLCHIDVEKTKIMGDPAGSLANRGGHYDEVERVLQDKMKSTIEASGRNSRQTRSDISELGNVLIRNCKFKEAEDIFRDILVMSGA